MMMKRSKMFIDIQMLHDICPLIFVIILLTHSAECCCNVKNIPLILHSKLLSWLLHNSNTGLKSVKLISAKNAMAHMRLSKCQLVFMTFFSTHAQNLNIIEFKKKK